MKKLKNATAPALFGLLAGVPGAAFAQQLTPPTRTERVNVAVEDLQISKVAHLGQLEKNRQGSSTAIAAIASSSAPAGKLTMSSVGGATRRTAITAKSDNTTAAEGHFTRSEVTSFPERTSKIATHGSVTKSLPLMARNALTAKASTTNSINPEPVSIKSITKQ